jgi:hypothetical protein
VETLTLLKIRLLIIYTHQTTALASSFIDSPPLQEQRQEPDFQQGQDLTSANPTVETADSDSTAAALAGQRDLADMGLDPNIYNGHFRSHRSRPSHCSFRALVH